MALLALVGAVLVASGAPVAAQGEWDCPGPPGTRTGYLFRTSDSGAPPYDIVRVDSATGAPTVVGSVNIPLDTVGFNTLDGYFYGTNASAIVRIDSSGRTTRVGYTSSGGDTSGDFDAHGHLWLLGSLPSVWSEIDLVPGSPTYGQVLGRDMLGYPGSQYRALGDWTYMNGPSGTGFYGVVDLTGISLPWLIYFDPATKTRTFLGEMTGMPGGIGKADTRSSFTDGTSLYVHAATSGVLYRVDLATRTATALPQSPGTLFSDGAQCVAASASTVNVVKRVKGRNTPLDQFRVSLRGSGGEELAGATTTGTDTRGGTRAETGPVSVAPAHTYQVTDRLAGSDLAPDPRLYDTSAACVNDASGATVPLTGGAGSWTLALPRSGGAYTCTVTNTARGTGGLELVKQASPLVVDKPGQVVTYTLTVHNTGETSVPALTLTDSQQPGPLACALPDGGLLPAHEATCATLTHTVTQTELGGGPLVNSARVEGNDSLGNPVGADDAVTVGTVQPSPEIGLTKSVSPETVTAAGQDVTYTYRVTNTGLAGLHEVGVTEHGFTGTGDLPAATCEQTTLAPGAATDCTVVYEATQADIDAGGIDNAATAKARDAIGASAESPQASAHVTAVRAPAITLAKSVSPNAVDHAGAPVTYTFILTNTGNTTVTNADIVDTAFTGHGQPGPLVCPPGSDRTLAPGEHLTCTVAYTAVQADIDRKHVDNTAHATAWQNGTEVRSADAKTHFEALFDARLSLTKQATPDDSASFTVGRVITYTYQVRNTGNTSMSGIGITETEFTGRGTVPEITCPEQTEPLAPGETVVCQGTYTLVQADIEQGTVSNTAHATGTAPDGLAVRSGDATQVLTAPAQSALTLTKTAEPTEIDAAGDTVTYHFHITNTGATTLTDTAIVEIHFSGTGGRPLVHCEQSTLAPGASTECTSTYEVTQADIDAGSLTNDAVASATNPSGVTIYSDSSVVTVTARPTASLSLDKTADPDVVTGEGDTVRYAYTVRNTGGVTLHGVTVKDTAFTGTGTPPAVTCPAAEIAPGKETECTAVYEVTKADIAAGGIVNTAIATAARDDDGAPVTSHEAEATVRVATSSLSLAKSVAPETATTGDEVTYTYRVENTGETALTGLTVDDTAFTGTGTRPVADCPATTLDAGATVTCTATYTVTEADAQAGEVVNTATATARNDAGTEVVSAPARAVLTTGTAPAPGDSLALGKTAEVTDTDGDGRNDPGDIVHWTLTVTNTGDGALHDIRVVDPVAGPVTCPTASLAPGASTICTATPHTLTEEDARRGYLANIATAHGTGTTGLSVTSPPARVTVPVTPGDGGPEGGYGDGHGDGGYEGR
ncbi:hypothetical protein BU197_01985 [Streptomyces sp. CBMA291]|nr:hypothetical protein [Streptomyces sp. CBMA291]MBD0713716.1 hypothetical protein [Streptomyces sp. CBMA370]